MYLSEIHHRHLVKILGYGQESGFQMLVFEYLPNGSMRNHLYGIYTSLYCSYLFLNTIGAHIYASYIYIHFLADTKQDSSTKLEFKQRISIALGAAKGRLRETDITTVLDLIEPR